MKECVIVPIRFFITFRAHDKETERDGVTQTHVYTFRAPFQLVPSYNREDRALVAHQRAPTKQRPIPLVSTFRAMYFAKMRITENSSPICKLKFIHMNIFRRSIFHLFHDPLTIYFSNLFSCAFSRPARQNIRVEISVPAPREIHKGLSIV